MDVIRGKFPNSSVHPSLCSLQTLNVFFPFCFSIWFTLNTTLKQKHSGTTEKNQFVCSHLSSACWDSFVRFSFITCHVSVHRERKSQGHPRIAPVHQAGCVCVCVTPPTPSTFISLQFWVKKKKNEHPPLHSDLLYYDMLCYSLKSCLTAGYRSGGSFIPGPLL